MRESIETLPNKEMVYIVLNYIDQHFLTLIMVLLLLEFPQAHNMKFKRC